MLRSAANSFLGSHTNKIDAKGRVAAPADFRKALDLAHFHGFFCIPSVDGPYLDCGGPDYIENLKAIIYALPPYDPGRRALERQVLGAVKPITIDSDGRFVLTKALRKHAGLDDLVQFVGVGDTFQMWRPSTEENDVVDDIALARETLARLQNANHQSAAAVTGPMSPPIGANGQGGGAA
ncbi:MAG: division/cell wall cluster transcriptional repressor MraZ [Pseudomonadota bacterium]